MHAIEYLAWYKKAIQPHTDALISEWRETARAVGQLPTTLVEHFADMAFRGKLVRGALTVLGYELSGKKVTGEILRASLTVELFHAGILVQDDIMDQDEKRRDVPSLHVQFRNIGHELRVGNSQLFGESLAVCISDFAFYASWQSLLSCAFPDKNRIAAGLVLSQCIQKLTLGQAMDVANVHTKKASREEILQIFRYKTAEYTGVLPLEIGACLAGITNTSVRDAITTYGRCFGWAFQIQDDILGMFGDAKTGKPVGNDIRRGKQTLLMLELAKQLSQKETLIVEKIFGNPLATDEDIGVIQHMVREKGVLASVSDLGTSYITQAKEVVPTMTIRRNKQELLLDLLLFVIHRST